MAMLIGVHRPASFAPVIKMLSQNPQTLEAKPTMGLLWRMSILNPGATGLLGQSLLAAIYNANLDPSDSSAVLALAHERSQRLGSEAASLIKTLDHHDLIEANEQLQDQSQEHGISTLPTVVTDAEQFTGIYQILALDRWLSLPDAARKHPSHDPPGS